MRELLDLLQNVSGCFGVSCRTYTLPMENPESFDLGFRGRWFAEEPYRSLEQLLGALVPGYLYMMTDGFQIRYLLAVLQEGILVVGPYVGEEEKDLFNYDQLTVPQADRIRQYRNLVPLVQEPEVLLNVVLRFVTALEGETKVLPVSLDAAKKDEKKLLADMVSEDKSFMDEVAARYRIEDSLMEAIREGDYTKALQCTFQGHPVDRQYTESLQSSKNTTLTFNTLCRKAVEQAAVHPAHIDRVSREFAAEINRATRISELAELYEKMIRRYCFLVRNFSLKGYSERIRNTIDFIDFHLEENLSLEQLADCAAVSKKALSAQFHRETGQTLTEYINQKRIGKARQYLAVTELPVQEIAEKVGILDVNYFSRLFRKLENMSPSEYRRRFGVPQ